MDGMGDHCAKSGTERQVPHDLTQVWNLQVDLIGVESRIVITRAGESRGVGRDVESFVNGYQVQLDRKVKFCAIV
jgi:hypothetical protein